MKVIRQIFTISYMALSRLNDIEELNSNKWEELRNQTFLTLNELVFRWVSEIEYSTKMIQEDAARQLILDSLSEILTDHLRARLKIYKICRKLNLLNLNTFCFVSLIYFYIKTISKVLKSTASSLKSYSLNSINIDPDSRIICAVGFPSHSFTLDLTELKKAKKKGELYASFAEYLRENHINKKEKITIISFDEYERLSKREEKKYNLTDASMDEFSTMDRINLVRKVVPNQIISRVFLIVSRLTGSILTSRKNYLASIYYYIFWCRSISLNEIFAEWDDRIDAIFSPTFSKKLGVIPFDKIMSKKLFYYNYSHNMGEAPTRYLHKYHNYSPKFSLELAMAEMPPSLWSISGKAVGFSDIYEYINTFRIYLNYNFGYKLPVNAFVQSPQKSTMFGFERELKQGSIRNNIRYVMVFDVPPETTDEYFTHLSGNPWGRLEVVKGFISDVLDVCEKRRFKVLLKPKYSLYNYVSEYRQYLTEISNIYEEFFEVLDPYTSIRSVMHSASATITMPYSSTKLAAESIGVQSTYYLPEEFKYYDGGTTLFGKSELSLFLEQV